MLGLSSSMSSNPHNQIIIDDEIDLIPYLKHLFDNKRFYIFSVIVATILAIILTIFLPKQYKGVTTFITPKTMQLNGASALFSSLGMRSQSLGGQTGIYSEFIMPVFKSYKIKKYVANQLINDGIVDAFIKDVPEELWVDTIIFKLNLNKKVTLKTEKGVSIISFDNENPRLVLPVLNTYLMALINLNDELNVDSDKLEIIQLDEAQFPKHHFFPIFPKYLFS